MLIAVSCCLKERILVDIEDTIIIPHLWFNFILEIKVLEAS